jgi:hypothetical protein
MSGAYHMVCTECGQLIEAGDGIGPPVYTPCKCLESDLGPWFRVQGITTLDQAAEEIQRLRAREEQLERHIAELNSRDFAQEVFILEAEIDELRAQVIRVIDFLEQNTGFNGTQAADMLCEALHKHKHKREGEEPCCDSPSQEKCMQCQDIHPKS